MLGCWQCGASLQAPVRIERATNYLRSVLDSIYRLCKVVSGTGKPMDAGFFLVATSHRDYDYSVAPANKDKNKSKQVSVSPAVIPNDSLNVLSLIVPVHNNSLADGLVKSKREMRKYGNCSVWVPSADRKSIYASFHNQQLPQAGPGITGPKAEN